MQNFGVSLRETILTFFNFEFCIVILIFEF